jgi:hypothetical protein
MRPSALSWPRRLFLRELFLLASVCVLFVGCRSRHTGDQPTIEFSRIPPADEGGPDRFDIIEGRVSGARDNQQIVVYARSGMWWVQPMVEQPFTKIQPNLTWKSATHLGSEYAALLVDSGYHPLPTIDALPAEGGPVAAVATVQGARLPPTAIKTLQFSGYEWILRTAMGNRNGSLNWYDPANAWTDAKGFLHLRITRQADRWKCSEVALAPSFGYGTYLFAVEDVSHLEPAAVFSIFTWDASGTDRVFREMDIQLSQWGDPQNKNAQYVIQPYYIPANVSRFSLPAGVATHLIHWEPGQVSFESFRGYRTGTRARLIAQHNFTSSTPRPGGETIRMNLCAIDFAKVPLQHEAEVVIEKAQYLP